MLKVRTAVATLDRDHAIAERRARRPFHRAACPPPRFRTVSHENTAAAVDTPNLGPEHLSRRRRESGERTLPRYDGLR
jgi:hypothetical protein